MRNVLIDLILFLVALWILIPSAGACDYFCQREASGGVGTHQEAPGGVGRHQEALPDTRDYFGRRNGGPTAQRSRDYFGRDTGGMIPPDRCDYFCRKNGEQDG